MTLALGIGATTAAFSVLDTVLLRPLPFPSSDKLVVLHEVDADKRHLVAVVSEFRRLANTNDDRSRMSSATTGRWVRVTDADGTTVRARALVISRDFFATFGVAPYLGREFSDDENRRRRSAGRDGLV